MLKIIQLLKETKHFAINWFFRIQHKKDQVTNELAKYKIYAEFDKDPKRYEYALLYAFALHGAQISINPRILFQWNQDYARKYILTLPKLKFRSTIDFPKYDLVLNFSDSDITRPNCVSIKRDFFNDNVRHERNIFVWHYPMHPSVYFNELHKKTVRIGERNIKFFFSGDFTSKGYDLKEHVTLFNSFNRHQLREDLIKHFEIFEPKKQEDLERLEDYEISIINYYKVSLSQERYFRFLSRTVFFLALPGRIMPFCHNVIEAMHCGAIPILNYARFFDPPLVDGVNCLTFENNDISIAIKRAKNLSKSEVNLFKSNVQDYYQKFLDIENIASRFIDSGKKKILLNSEGKTISLMN